MWIKDNTCNGNFLDYFKPIDNVNFIDFSKRIDYKGQSTIENITSYYNIRYNKIRLYSNIRLNNINEIKIQEYIEKYNIKNLIGIHVRRTDYTGNFIGKLINGSNSDFEFFDYVEKYSKKNNFF